MICIYVRVHACVCMCVLTQVLDIREVTHLTNLKGLASLNLSNNPIEVRLGECDVCVCV